MTTNSSHPSRQLTLLVFNGEDTPSFLQGQLTNDVSQLGNKWQLSGYCNPKGRLLALFRLWKHGDQFYALIDSSIVETTVKRLRMYIMRSKVKIEVHNNIAFSYQYSSSQPRFKVGVENNIHTLSFGSRDLHITLQAETEENSYSEKWAKLNIAEGLPEISDKSVELFVPQMINLDLLDAINFKKGCYTGQEIVARMHYLGKLKQRMYVCETTHNCDVGAKIMSESKNAGHIVYCSDNSALAVLRNEFINTDDAESLTIDNDNGQKIELNVNDKQPYSLELKT